MVLRRHGGRDGRTAHARLRSRRIERVGHASCPMFWTPGGGHEKPGERGDAPRSLARAAPPQQPRRRRHHRAAAADDEQRSASANEPQNVSSSSSSKRPELHARRSTPPRSTNRAIPEESFEMVFPPMASVCGGGVGAATSAATMTATDPLAEITKRQAERRERRRRRSALAGPRAARDGLSARRPRRNINLVGGRRLHLRRPARRPPFRPPPGSLPSRAPHATRCSWPSNRFGRGVATSAPVMRRWRAPSRAAPAVVATVRGGMAAVRE